MKQKLALISLLLLHSIAHASIPHLNLFNPYDWLIQPSQRPCGSWQIDIAYEGLIKARSYQADEDSQGNSSCFRKKADILQLYHDEVDLLAALKGDEFTTALGQLSTQFNLNDDDGTFGLFIPSTKLHINNFSLSTRYHAGHNWFIAAFLPIISMKLDAITWNPSPNNNNDFDSIAAEKLITDIEKIGTINLRNFNQSGIGDLALMAWWGRYFPQARPILRNVYVGFRGGMTFPIGKKADENSILRLPFGSGEGIGILLGGDLQLRLGHKYYCGVDAELTHLFGKTLTRRIKSDPAQTDLVLLSEACAFKQPGFTQHFTLYGGTQNLCWGIALQIAYQYTRQQEDKLFLASDHFAPSIVNSAESLQGWTTHNIIINCNCDFYKGKPNRLYYPYFSLFIKHGFNGSRAILADTIGMSMSLSF